MLLDNIATRPGSLILITDKLDAPADFILLNFLSSHLKNKSSKCVFVSFQETFSHWKSVASRLVRFSSRRVQDWC